MPILILGDNQDEHTNFMLNHLLDLGHDTELIDSADFPVTLQITYNPIQDEGYLTLPNQREIPFNQISAVYWRCYNGVADIPLEDPDQSYIAENDSRSLFETFLQSLDTHWVNSHRAFLLHQTKPVQLAIVSRVLTQRDSTTLLLPQTLLTNSPHHIRDFHENTHPCIFKPVQGGAHTLDLQPDHLTDQNLENLEYSPVTIQQKIEGVDIRVFIAGRRIFACQIKANTLDFRDDPNPDITPTDLPGGVVATCFAIADALDLKWTGIDLRMTSDKKYIFLEANPSPMFLGFEDYTNLPLTEALTTLLTNPPQ